MPHVRRGVRLDATSAGRCQGDRLRYLPCWDGALATWRRRTRQNGAVDDQDIPPAHRRRKMKRRKKSRYGPARRRRKPYGRAGRESYVGESPTAALGERDTPLNAASVVASFADAGSLERDVHSRPRGVSAGGPGVEWFRAELPAVLRTIAQAMQQSSDEQAGPDDGKRVPTGAFKQSRTRCSPQQTCKSSLAFSRLRWTVGTLIVPLKRNIALLPYHDRDAMRKVRAVHLRLYLP